MAGVIAQPYPHLEAGSTADGLILRSHWEGDGEVWLELIYAAPQAKFSGLLLRKVVLGEALPFTELDKADVGGVLRIKVGRGGGTGTTNLVYVLTEHLDSDTYVGAWPD